MVDIPPIAYTSKIDASKTIHEIHEILAQAGAGRIATSYDEGIASGISFALQTEAWGARVFDLPVNIEAMHRKLVTLKRAGKLPSLSKWDAESTEQAARVAWRVAKIWLASQFSLLETGMIPLEQIMLPFLKTGGFESPTVYELAIQQPDVLAIDAPRSNP